MLQTSPMNPPCCLWAASPLERPAGAREGGEPPYQSMISNHNNQLSHREDKRKSYASAPLLTLPCRCRAAIQGGMPPQRQGGFLDRPLPSIARRCDEGRFLRWTPRAWFTLSRCWGGFSVLTASASASLLTLPCFCRRQKFLRMPRLHPCRAGHAFGITRHAWLAPSRRWARGDALRRGQGGFLSKP